MSNRLSGSHTSFWAPQVELFTADNKKRVAMKETGLIVSADPEKEFG
jgi:hypothetical protein